MRKLFRLFAYEVIFGPNFAMAFMFIRFMIFWRFFLPDTDSISFTADGLISSLYLATALKILYHIFIWQAGFCYSVCKRGKIFFVLCEALFYSHVDKVGNGTIRFRRFDTQGTVKIRIEIYCCSFWLCFHDVIMAT